MCAVCTVEFEGYQNRKYCDTCRKAVRIENLRRFMAKNKKHIQEYQKQYAAEHKEEIARNKKKWADKNPDYAKIQYAINREESLLAQYNRKQDQRYRLLKKYSPDLVCAYCGENWYPALSIDHMDGDGHKKRKYAGNSNYAQLLAGKHGDRLQVLCFSCNRVKGTMTDAEFRAKYPERLKLGKQKMESV